MEIINIIFDTCFVRSIINNFSLLQCLSIPGILCTKGQRFKKHIELAKSKQANLVKLPDELLTYLKDNIV